MLPPAQAKELASPVYQRLLKEVCTQKPEVFNAFLNRLFNTLNWTITEFTVSCKELRVRAVTAWRATQWKPTACHRTPTLLPQINSPPSPAPPRRAGH